MGTAALIQAADAREYAAAGALFREYAAEINIDLCFQDFAAELKRLEEVYGPPCGCLLLAVEPGPPGGGSTGGASLAGTPVGCGALRRLSAERSELKRLYVRPRARGWKLGRMIAEALIARARRLGYSCVLLDTLRSMSTAQSLYRSLGFKETEQYYDNPMPDMVYMRLDL